MPEFILTITFNSDTKACGVTGPVKNYDLCKLGLALAEDVLKRYRKTQIVVPRPSVTLKE